MNFVRISEPDVNLYKAEKDSTKFENNDRNVKIIFHKELIFFSKKGLMTLKQQGRAKKKIQINVKTILIFQMT